MAALLDWLVEKEPSFRPSRLPSLYSDLAVQKTSNPEGYAANVTAWEAALTRASLAGQLPAEQRLILQTSNDLLTALASPRYGRPSGLGCVLDDCVRQGKMIDLSDFRLSEKSIYSRSWLPTPWAILRWSLRQVGVVNSGSYHVDGQLRRGSLVLVPALEEVWRRIQSLRETASQRLTDRIVSRELFVTEVNQLLQTTLSSDDVCVLLQYLSRDKQMLSHNATTIKFKAAGSSCPEPVSQEDCAIANLKSLISDLTGQITNLSDRVVQYQQNAQSAVKAGNKTSALSALRSKKLVERSLQSRSDTLHQLEEVYVQLQGAADQVEVVAAMQASAGALETLNQKVGGIDRVETVLEDLREEMAKVDEVNGVLAEPLNPTAVIDDSEIDDELEQLEQQEKDKQAKLLEEAKDQAARQEAEATRQRLAELDALQSPGQEELNASFEKDLSKSVEEIRRIDLNV